VVDRLPILVRGVPLHDLAFGAGLIAGILLAVIAIKTLARRAFENRGESAVRTTLMAISRHTHTLLFVLPAAVVAAYSIEYPARRWLLIGAELSAFAQVASWLSALLHHTFIRFEEKHALDPTTGTTLRIWRLCVVFLIWAAALMTGLAVAGVDVRTLLTGLGIGGVAIALATQNILSDLFATLSIVLEKPFVVGDTIQVAAEIGTVERIALKTTRVRSLAGEELIYSNSQLLNSCVHNLGRGIDRRVVAPIRVDYRNGPKGLDLVPAILRQAVESQPHLRFDRAHLALFSTWGGYEYELVYFVPTRDVITWMDAHHAVLLSIAKGLHDAGLSVASLAADGERAAVR
jgi:small-conductance mechanosensitive channel